MGCFFSVFMYNNLMKKKSDTAQEGVGTQNVAERVGDVLAQTNGTPEPVSETEKLKKSVEDVGGNVEDVLALPIQQLEAATTLDELVAIYQGVDAGQQKRLMPTVNHTLAEMLRQRKVTIDDIVNSFDGCDNFRLGNDIALVCLEGNWRHHRAFADNIHAFGALGEEVALKLVQANYTKIIFAHLDSFDSLGKQVAIAMIENDFGPDVVI